MSPHSIVDDDAVVAEARALLRSTERAAGRRGLDVNERLMAWTTKSPAFKVNLFRFVDAYPACVDRSDVVRHLLEYLDTDGTPKTLRLGLGLVERDIPLSRRIAATAARRGIEQMAGTFIVGSTINEVAPRIASAWADGFATTLDFLGEKTLTDEEADAYAAKVLDAVVTLGEAAGSWPQRDVLETDPWGRLGRANLSLKPTALSPHLEAMSIERGVAEVIERIEPIVLAAARLGVTLHFDNEHDEAKDAIFALVRACGERWPDQAFGCVVQAYRRDAYADLEMMIEWSRRTLSIPLQIRLVKGAYWDAETISARAHGWESPVWDHKAESDLAYERCIELLLRSAGAVRPAIASHNVRSVAYAVTVARSLGLGEGAFEVQVLHGMAEPFHKALRDRGLRVRVYRPMGELIPGMGYLVRRLLENTANDSFVRQGFTSSSIPEHLLRRPVVAPRAPKTIEAASQHGASVTDPLAEFVCEPLLELRRQPVRSGVLATPVPGTFEVPLLIDGRSVRTAETSESLDPGRNETVVCTSFMADESHVADAVGFADNALETWGRRTLDERATVLERAATLMQRDRMALIQLIIHEAGKPIAEADADVGEAIDFLRYYATSARQLGGRQLAQVPGERNTFTWRPRGVAAVISPWNFPLAIPCGMVAGPLVMGNPVILKPAEQTPGVALQLVRLLHEAGVPGDALQLLPGRGEVVGRALVEHPLVANVVFTGSRAVGLDIVARAAIVQPGQRVIRRVTAELGGKNPVLVDSDADLDVAVSEIVKGAFGYAGQKCSATSRVIASAGVFDRLVERIAGVLPTLVVGHPSDPSVTVGPVIDAESVERVAMYRELADKEGELIAVHGNIPTGGWFAPPAFAVVDDPLCRVATEEVFGPMLVAMRAESWHDAVRIANDSPYALTAGLFSRSPANIDYAVGRLAAGNIYVNRSTVGAMVGRQPFGGSRLSGCGMKAGGPDYLLQFADATVITENTLRQGFSPDLVS
jgi:RHH-type transcriptional regulator, proline utilization regulon repressor / proline dehydrogenase / delta 1-pyrroline-5-carboxylate dehydrogenase